MDNLGLSSARILTSIIIEIIITATELILLFGLTNYFIDFFQLLLLKRLFQNLLTRFFNCLLSKYKLEIYTGKFLNDRCHFLTNLFKDNSRKTDKDIDIFVYSINTLSFHTKESRFQEIDILEELFDLPLEFLLRVFFPFLLISQNVDSLSLRAKSTAKSRVTGGSNSSGIRAVRADTRGWSQ